MIFIGYVLLFIIFDCFRLMSPTGSQYRNAIDLAHYSNPKNTEIPHAKSLESLVLNVKILYYSCW